MFTLPGLTPIVEPDDDDESEELSPRQERFVEEYMKDYKGSEAARRAGYSEHSAGWAAYRLLKIPKVRRAIRLERKKRADAAIGQPITKEWVIERMAWLAMSQITDYADWGPEHKETRNRNGDLVVSSGVNLVPSDELSHAATYAIVEIGNTKEGVKFKLADKRAALIDLAKLLGMITEKLDVTGKVETSGPDIGNMTPDQLKAYEAFLIAMAGSVTGGA